MFNRPILTHISDRVRGPRRFIQVLSGPRQTGKTTLAQQLIEEIGIPCHYVAADEPSLKSASWVEQHWETARTKARAHKPKKAILVLDEVQRIGNWSEIVKRLWDEDTSERLSLHVVLLGSSPLLVQSGLTESLAGRFEIIPITHWSFAEMHSAFGWELDQYIFYGGYPGAANLIGDPPRWSRYITESLIETTVSRDILLMKRVDKPALLRRLLELGCAYSGRVLSYQKMVGQLQDAGNTTTLAHYLDLLAGAGLLMGLPKFSGQRTRQRSSSPKLQVLNTALMTAPSGLTLKEAREDHEYWGHLTESAVGATLANGLRGSQVELYYWLDRNREVDFVMRRGKTIVVVEVKSSLKRTTLPGIDAFSEAFPVKKKLLVGGQGIALSEFLVTPPEKWLG